LLFIWKAGMPANNPLDSAIRKIPGFPKPGILFYDITGILVDTGAFAYCIDRMMELYADEKIDAVAAIESRGFIFASPFAYKRKIPLILLRKKGKLPGEKYTVSFTLEYGEDVLEMHKSDVKKGMRVLLVDDLIATGGTLNASAKLLAMGGASVAGIFGVVGLPFLNYEKALSGHRVTTLIQYHGE
jgi:adenine phosphoribosyltransferase